MKWYEPGEDTFTLMDVLREERIEKKIIVDMGCSTGAITDLLDSSNFVISVDLNLTALEQLKGKNAIRSDLLVGIDQDAVDICIFNPPYLIDSDCPILGGGVRGREVIDRFIETVTVKLVYLLVIEANIPSEVKRLLEERGYAVKVCEIRRLLGETIVIFKAERL